MGWDLSSAVIALDDVSFLQVETATVVELKVASDGVGPSNPANRDASRGDLSAAFLSSLPVREFAQEDLHSRLNPHSPLDSIQVASGPGLAAMPGSKLVKAGGASGPPKSKMGVASDQVDDSSQAESMSGALFITPQVKNAVSPPLPDSWRVTKCAWCKKSTAIARSCGTRGLLITV